MRYKFIGGPLDGMFQRVNKHARSMSVVELASIRLPDGKIVYPSYYGTIHRYVKTVIDNGFVAYKYEEETA